MAIFLHTSLKNGTEKIHGKIEAESQREARELLRRQGFLPVRVIEEGSTSVKMLLDLKNTRPSRR